MQTGNAGRVDPSQNGDAQNSAVAHGIDDTPLFGTLLASRPKRERRMTALATGWKVVGADTKVEAGDASAAPVFTPFTVAPRLTNPEDVARALERTYPPLLRDAGIGRDVIMWFFIDETDAVVRTQVNKSSGYPALDEAAQTVAGIMRSSPAFNRDRKVQAAPFVKAAPEVKYQRVIEMMD